MAAPLAPEPAARPAELDRLPQSPSQKIGRYEILGGLSVGGMAELYLAYTAGPAGFRKFVALKKILPGVRRDPEAVRMFIDEARLTAGMSHSNIAQVYDLGQEGDDLYIAMEFIPGLDLSRIVRACKRKGLRLPFGLAAMVVRESCLALHYAHHYQDPSGRSSHIVHRDVSPKNLMLTYSGNVKVVDFGIALFKVRLEQDPSAASTLKGTAAYMAPEQIQGKPLDSRTDLYSLGVVLHELLTGQRLFSAKTDVEVLQKVLGGEVPAPHQLNPRVPPELSAVAMRALERDPGQRFATGKEMARAIEAAAGPLMYDDEQAAGFMADLFAERLSHTRALLDLAHPEGDEGQLRSAARELRDDGIRLGHTTEAPALRPGQDAGEPPPTGSAALAERIRRARKILAVDDDKVMTMFLRMSLGPYGYDVVECQSANQVMQAIEAEHPDLVLLDVMMPEKDGYAVCQEIREQKKDRYLPIVFLSAACSLDERVKGLTVGADDFVKKPFEPAELAARIRAHISRVTTLRAGAR